MKLKEILQAHRTWINSDKRVGMQANLETANLKGAELEEAFLPEARLRRVNLDGARLRGANLRGADSREARLEKTSLWGANSPFPTYQKPTSLVRYSLWLTSSSPTCKMLYLTWPAYGRRSSPELP